jgi:hypothetical protein
MEKSSHEQVPIGVVDVPRFASDTNNVVDLKGLLRLAIHNLSASHEGAAMLTAIGHTLSSFYPLDFCVCNGCFVVFPSVTPYQPECVNDAVLRIILAYLLCRP